MHSYYGMPMHSSYCAVWQARMGARDEALTALDRGMLSRFHEPFNQFVEAAPDIGDGMWPNSRAEPWLTKRTCFVTACGGFLTSALLGFSGLQLRHGARVQDWPTYDVALPGDWKAMEVQKLWAHGEPYRLVAKPGGKASLTPAE